jgi:YidC/Oxa1 family membrane protein insertase
VVGLFNSFVDLLYEVLKFYQGLTESVLGNQSYWFAIVLLTLSVRVLLIPLTVKQVRSSRAMSALQPDLKKLQEKHKDNRQRLNEEMMALYRERGVNPLAGCLPLLVQMPFFFALYQVIYRKDISGEPNILLNHGFFGIRLDTVWWQLPWDDRFFSVTGIAILLLILAMGATTFISQRQLMSRQTMQMNPQQAMLMKVLPLMFVVFAVGFPLAVIIYWLTSNLWSMGQQYMILRNQPLPEAAAAGTTQTSAKGGKRTVGEVTRPAAKSGGWFATLRAQVEGAGTTRNGSDRPSNRSDGRSDGRSERQKGGAKSSGSGRQGGSGSSTTRKGSGGGQRAGSSSRSGGGKGSARGQQRRRKR